ncbi:spore cortex biosynthesis protein YabQ [Aquibacillus halophilus]|uniref:Spore cortex biosynthesis protein YabQ n=1 Tax=Aquibacillus halophilus TaxID=930132 RepID=A0A6A8DH28_9BACI|nr:spore cortex biosynthesis protein YabQ [Aquibacillus halophilus]
MTLSIQFFTIISMIAGGLYLGAAIDTFRRFEFYWKKRIIFSYIIEICFWLLQTLILFYLLYLVNQGELRFYILLALLCGYAAYKSVFEKTYRNILEKLISTSISIYYFFYRLVQAIIVRPVILLFNFLVAVFIWIWGIVLTLLWLIIRVLWYPVKLVSKLIWFLTPNVVKKYFIYLAGFYNKIKNTIRKWWNEFRS